MSEMTLYRLEMVFPTCCSRLSKPWDESTMETSGSDSGWGGHGFWWDTGGLRYNYSPFQSQTFQVHQGESFSAITSSVPLLIFL